MKHLSALWTRTWFLDTRSILKLVLRHQEWPSYTRVYLCWSLSPDNIWQLYLCMCVYMSAFVFNWYLCIFTCESVYIYVCVSPHTYMCMLRRRHAQFGGTHATVVCGKAKAVTRFFQAPAPFSSAHIGTAPRPGGNILCNATVLLFQDLARIFLGFFSSSSSSSMLYTWQAQQRALAQLLGMASICRMYAQMFLQVQRM